MRTTLGSIAAAAIVLATLTACNPFTDPYTDEQRDGGVTPEAAEALINSLEGVTDADYETVSWYSPGEGGLFSSEGMDVVLSVTVDPEYSVADPEGWLRFLAATAWSVNDRFPKGDVIIALTGGQDRVFDWQTIARDVFDDDSLNTDRVRLDLRDSIPEDAVVITVFVGSYGDLFGRWPTEPVQPDDGLIAHEPPTISVVPAISDAYMNEHTIQDDDELYPDCFWVEFTRGVGGAGTFTGAVDITVLDSDGEFSKSTRLEGDASSERLCYTTGNRPPDASIILVTSPADGFTDVTETLHPE